ncbi:MAG: DUF302 domain-containing protein [Acidobacteriaceae bacterium]|nr:DUF302 domain-containing protein [Acidobacteriaceae bacterium]
MNLSDDQGLSHIRSGFDVGETLKRLETLLERKAIKVFCRIDHSGEAAKAGFVMRPTQLLMFGNPKAGTPFMLEWPTTAIDLPLKALVWEDEDQIVRLTYNSAEYLRERHQLQGGLEPLRAAEALFSAAVDPGFVL